jgi:competence protein ComEC
MGPIPIIALAFTVGIGLGLVFPTPPWAAALAAGFAAVALLCSVATGRSLALATIASAVALGWARPAEPVEHRPPEPSPTPCLRLFEGRVVAAPVGMDDRSRTVIELRGCSGCLARAGPVEPTPVDGTMFLTVIGDQRPAVSRDDRVRVIAAGKPIPIPDNPPGRLQRRDRAQWSAVIDRADGVVRIAVGASGPGRIFDALRGDLGDFWQRTLGRSRSQLARALTLGEQSVLDPGQKERFRRTGTAHLLAVSGLHLGLVVLAAFTALRWLLVRLTPLSRRFDVERFAAAAGIPLAIGFALLAGGRPPVVRACVMAVCALAAIALGRRASPAEAVALAAAALLAWNPADLARPGFQLSFAAVLAFLLVLRPSGRRRHDLDQAPQPRRSPVAAAARMIGRGAVKLLKASAAATAATTPLVLYHFDRVSLIGLPVNAVAVPLTAFLVLPGLMIVTALYGIWPAAAAALAQPVGALLGALDAGLGLVADLPCTLDSPEPLTAAGIGAGCLAALLALAHRRRGALISAAGAVLVLAAALITAAPRFPPGNLTVDFLDVGQGDATLISFPDGERWLVDAGGNHHGAFDVGEHVVVPTLRALGVRRIDTLVLTHPDPDHVGGMPAVVSALDVGRIWDNGQGAAEGAVEEYGRLLDLAAERAIPLKRTPGICGSHRIAGAIVRVIHPCHDEAGYDPGLTHNDNSLVLHLSLGASSVLLTGDLSAEGEQVALERAAVPRADVLKLGHHGSRTSSTNAFLDAVAPTVGVASCGAWNRYGIPHLSLRRTLARRWIALLRTDRNGAVRISTDGGIIEIEPRRRARAGS